MKKFWKEIVIVLSVFVLYGNTLNNGFVLDDFSAIVENRFVQAGTENIKDIFTTHYRKGYWSHPGDLYRPLVLTSFALETAFSSGEPFIYHFINLVVYGLIGLFLFWIVAHWVPNEKLHLPFIVVLLYLFHPIHTEVVANIKSRDELMSLMFVLAAFLSYINFTKSKKMVFLMGAGLSFFLALLSKESSVVFLALIPMSGYVFYNQKKNEIIQVLAALGAPLVAFLLMRGNALANQLKTVPVSLSLQNESPVNHILQAGYHLVLYMVKLILPISLSSQYPEFYNGPTSMVLGIGALGLLLHAALLYFGVKWFLEKRAEGYFILFYLITSFLHSNLIMVIGTHFGERLLFTPSIAFSLLIGFYLAKYASKIPPKRVWGSVLVVLVLYSFTVISRNKEWKSNFTLYEADVAKKPESAILNYWYALELTNNKHLKNLTEKEKNESLQKALDYLIIANELKPDFGDAEAQIGLVYYKLGRNDEALPYFKKSLSSGKGSVGTLNNIAAIYFSSGDFENAKLYYEQAVTTDPYFKDAWGNLGITYAQLNDFTNAERAFLRAIELSPTNAQLYFYMGMTMNQTGRSEQAVPYFEKAFELDPSLQK